MATNFVNCSYQEIIDLHTESDHVTVLGVHTPTGSTPRRMFSGFFNQFKKYKYNGCSIKLVPAARLPVDPLQVGVEPGQVYETPMDPRDALNPIMFHGCHGNDMGQILDMLYGSQDISESMKGLDATTIGGTVLSQAFYDVMERLYYKALTDNTWKKAHPQRGFKKAGLRPLVYSVAANRQISPGALGDVFSLGENDEVIQEMGDLHQFTALDSVKVDKSNLQFFTPRLTSLGWMDTRNALTTEDAYDGSSASLDDLLNKFTNYSELPSIFMGCILLPPAYGVEQYFRMIINHSFSFKNFRGISFKPEVSSVPSYYDANADLFDPEQYEGGGVSPGPDPDPDPPEPGPIAGTFAVWLGDPVTIGNFTGYKVFKYGEIGSEPDGSYADIKLNEKVVLIPYRSVPTEEDCSFILAGSTTLSDYSGNAYWDGTSWKVFDWNAATLALAQTENAYGGAILTGGEITGSGTAVTTAGSAQAYALDNFYGSNAYVGGTGVIE